MNFKAFSAKNNERCTSPEGFNHQLESWSAAEWTNAMMGEGGEACNLTKKLLRHRDGVAGNIKSEDRDVQSLKARAAKEIADVIIYADLAMQALGYDTSETVRDVFNAKSRELGCSILIGEESVDYHAEDCRAKESEIADGDARHCSPRCR